MSRWPLLVALWTSTVLAVSGCGGNSSPEAETPEPVETPETSGADDPGPADTSTTANPRALGRPRGLHLDLDETLNGESPPLAREALGNRRRRVVAA